MRFSTYQSFNSSGLPLRNSSRILRHSVRCSDGGTSERGRLPLGNLSLTGTGNPEIQKTSKTHGVSSDLEQNVKKHMPGRAPPIQSTHPLNPPWLDPKFMKKSIENKVPKKTADLSPTATQKEYSGELGSQNYSKMESKMDPKVKQKGSLLKNTTK